MLAIMYFLACSYIYSCMSLQNSWTAHECVPKSTVADDISVITSPYIEGIQS